jgi:ERF superfamily
MTPETTEVARREPTTMELIGQIANSPNFDASKMDVVERLVALKERTDAQERKNAYAAAMAALQAELPQIDKHGKIYERDSNKVRSTFARIEDIDQQIRPYLAKHGFCFSYDSQPAPGSGGEIRFLGTMTHSAGHSETKQIDLPIDTGGAKSKVQERSSTLSVGIRQLLRMHLNLIMRDVDVDGDGNAELATAREVATIKELLAKIDSPEAEAKFLTWVKASRFEEIQRRDVPRALSFLRAKAGTR